MIGIGREVIAMRPPNLSAKSIRTALARWTGHPAYLRALAAAGSQRVDLQGHPVGPVADEHRAYATQLLEQRDGLRQGGG